MAIRLRTVDGTRVALCAARTEARPDDVYLDDREHYALAAKFARDWDVSTYEPEAAIMEHEESRADE